MLAKANYRPSVVMPFVKLYIYLLLPWFVVFKADRLNQINVPPPPPPTTVYEYIQLDLIFNRFYNTDQKPFFPPTCTRNAPSIIISQGAGVTDQTFVKKNTSSRRILEFFRQFIEITWNYGITSVAFTRCQVRTNGPDGTLRFYSMFRRASSLSNVT